jgi:hypothetical protein
MWKKGCTNRLSTRPLRDLISRRTSSSAGPNALEFVLAAEPSLKEDAAGIRYVWELIYAVRSVSDCKVRLYAVDTEIALVESDGGGRMVSARLSMALGSA